MRNKVVIMSNWLEQFKDCSLEQQKEICYGMLMYGIKEEYIKSDDPVVNVALNFITPQIDAMQDIYDKQVKTGRQGGRPGKIDNKKVWELAREGKNGSQISEELGVPKTTIYSSEGWKKRNDINFA